MAGSVNWNIFLALLGLFISVFGLISNFLKRRMYLSEAMVATFYGVIIGPAALNLLDIESWFTHGIDYTAPNLNITGESSHNVYQTESTSSYSLDKFLLEYAKSVCAIQVLAAGIYLPEKYVFREWKSLLMFLGPVMAYTWLVIAALIYGILRALNISFIESLIIAAGASATDPVLANSVIAGRFADRHIPYHLRYILSAESGCNDGAAFPFLFVAIYWATESRFVDGVKLWFWKTWAYDILMAAVVGFAIGHFWRILMNAAEKADLVDKSSFLAYSIALALLITGSFATIQSDDLLACFMCGHAFTWEGKYRSAVREERFQEVIELLINLSFFVIFGGILPWGEWYQIGYERLLPLTIAVFLLKRVPIVMLLKPVTPVLRTNKEAFFAGWFGPIGVGCIFFAMLSKSTVIEAHPEYVHIWPVSAWLVLSSIVVHGMTVPLFNFAFHAHQGGAVRRPSEIERVTFDDVTARKVSSFASFFSPSPEPTPSVIMNKNESNTALPRMMNKNESNAMLPTIEINDYSAPKEELATEASAVVASSVPSPAPAYLP